jgi:hypothetical protein
MREERQWRIVSFAVRHRQVHCGDGLSRAPRNTRRAQELAALASVWCCAGQEEGREGGSVAAANVDAVVRPVVRESKHIRRGQKGKVIW